MNSVNVKRFFWSVALSALLTTPTFAATVSLIWESDCTGLGGTWGSPPANSPALGSCLLPAGYTIAAGDRLEVAARIDLAISGQMINEGNLSLLNDSIMRIPPHTSFLNRGTVILANKATLRLNKGSLSNEGIVRSEGTIENGLPSPTLVQWGIYNSGHIQVFDGGELINNGFYFDRDTRLTPNLESLLVDLGGVFINKGGSRFNPHLALIHGQLVNHAGSEMKLRRRLTVSGRGRLELAGNLIMWSEHGVLTVDEGGRFDATPGSYITNLGATLNVNGLLTVTSGTLRNEGPWSNYGVGTITTGGGGRLHATSRAVLVNDTGARIVNNGSVLIDCFVTLVDKGTVTGNAIGRSLCFQPPIKPPPRLDLRF